MNQIADTSTALAAVQGLVSGLLWVFAVGFVVKHLAKFNLLKIVILFASAGVVQWLIYNYSKISTLIDKLLGLFGF
ncbi:hypothetical protein BLI29_03115 [Listeria monocytogenes]|uniref:hypothetical protein n=1 Tax=Listeria TaxID=1637 RepID=UPI00027E85C4|nr:MULTISPECIES: hypothetical protein [Listeria]EAE6173294.1 hypothetical protein [Listeria monocytogenes]EAG7617635.1 hypothetical protein [Listeria monocytogenes]ECB9798248.1 hypothetical protein [Listeria monocytogenes]EEO3273138.1 hypothetical protein [Listeria monocytogenes]MBM5607438.1 hypothetical protein [Listeria ivanovii]